MKIRRKKRTSKMLQKEIEKKLLPTSVCEMLDKLKLQDEKQKQKIIKREIKRR